jgi:hypothetical protein
MKKTVEKIAETYEYDLVMKDELPDLICWAWGRLRDDWADLVSTNDQDGIKDFHVKMMLGVARHIRMTVRDIAYAEYMEAIKQRVTPEPATDSVSAPAAKK